MSITKITYATPFEIQAWSWHTDTATAFCCQSKSQGWSKGWGKSPTFSQRNCKVTSQNVQKQGRVKNWNHFCNLSQFALWPQYYSYSSHMLNTLTPSYQGNTCSLNYLLAYTKITFQAYISRSIITSGTTNKLV